MVRWIGVYSGSILSDLLLEFSFDMNKNYYCIIMVGGAGAFLADEQKCQTKTVSDILESPNLHTVDIRLICEDSSR